MKPSPARPRRSAFRPRSPAKPAPAAAPRPAPSRNHARRCGGAGKIRHAQGFFTLERTCPTCHGRGQVIDDPCKVCGGGGRVTRERTLSVNIPAGVEDGTRIRLAGEGEAGLRGGPPGDLYIFLEVGTARILPARRRRPALPRADLDGQRRAWRRIRSAGDRRQQGKGQSPGRHADRPPLPAGRQRHAGAAGETNRRHVRSSSGGNAAKPHQTPARAAGGVRKAVVGGNPAGIGRFLQSSQRVS